MEFTAEAIAAFLGGTVEGDQTVTVNHVAKIEEGTKGALSFLSNPKYEEHIYTTEASIVMVTNDFAPRQAIKATLLRVENPYAAFAKLLELYVANKPQKNGIHALSSIAASATIAPDVYVGQYSVIEENASIGEGTKIYPQVYIGDRVKIGTNCTIYAGVKIFEECVIGNNVILQGGVVIGGDGFGFAPQEDGTYSKIPQIGNVVIQDDVEIGANTCIDRATMGSTIIHKGVKLDNLIQIAHNVAVGENTVIAAQAGIAGSTKIGTSVLIGGQVGIVGHLTIADRVKISSQSGVSNSISTEGAAVLGSPAINGLSHHRAHAVFKELPALRAKVFELERELKKLTTADEK